MRENLYRADGEMRLHTLQACVKDIGPEMDTDVEMSKRKENSTLHFLIMYDDHQLFKFKVNPVQCAVEY
ncbi:hypothetical protein HPB47_014340 [Ixodes persulcatus]|uniref:Uncharacterized protein n=1 Tax=Ixodes persulcatus TaxID=34615 RepID=A0AC60R3J3_IXOPE|nr:hypothetical protein HPB47_014340 [Ixodes persulcatus]